MKPFLEGEAGSLGFPINTDRQDDRAGTPSISKAAVQAATRKTELERSAVTGKRTKSTFYVLFLTGVNK